MPGATMKDVTAEAERLSTQSYLVTTGATRQMSLFSDTHSKRMRKNASDLQAILSRLGEMQGNGQDLAQAWQDYVTDAAQGMIPTMDTLRERGDIFVEHEAAGCPPVLIYDYYIIMDGADLPRPCNYYLIKIVVAEGTSPTDPTKRPYVIIDPCAGHGTGIGGFKTDSQVGVALKYGHPVYFIGFRRMPEKGQTFAHVTQAEAEFIREVHRRHPEAPNLIVTGNCQGGWATLILAAINPELTGPIVLNGAPTDTWAGTIGDNPIRYNGGVLGGMIHPMMQGDLGNGVFDGAAIVGKFEELNPARNYFGKYASITTFTPRSIRNVSGSWILNADGADISS